MTDDRLRRWLEAADRPEPPNPEFAAALLDELREELGFGSATSALGRARVRRPVRLGRGRRGHLDLLLVAVVTLTAAGALIGVTGALRDRLAVTPPTHGLAAIRAAGHIRIAIRPDSPQSTLSGQPAAGFDADVADEIGRRLGVAPEPVIEAVGSILSPPPSPGWDIALPSVPSWTIDPTAFAATDPYYRWPHYLIVPSSSTAASAADVAAGPICAVAGDAGAGWLQGDYGGAATSPVTANVMTRARDDECLAAIASGVAIAAVTAHLSAADLAVRAEIRSIGGPAPEPRVVIVPGVATDPDVADVVRAVNNALAAMRADGTLTRLSQRRFGGADLTAN